MSDLDEAVFLFTFPPIQSAIKIHGLGEGARAQLDIPENGMGSFIKLLQWRGGVMEARVRLVDDGEREERKREGQWSYDQTAGLG